MFFREVIVAPEFQATMSTAEFHYRVGRLRGEARGRAGPGPELLAAAWSVRDSSIGMNVAAKALEGNLLAFECRAT